MGPRRDHPREGPDVTLFGTGVMTSLCACGQPTCSRRRHPRGGRPPRSIKPIDADLIVGSTTRTGCAVTAENATILGGFGAAVTEVLVASVAPVPVERIGVRDRWVDSGGINDLFTHHGMQPEDIAAAARRAMATRDGESQGDTHVTTRIRFLGTAAFEVVGPGTASCSTRS